MNGVEVKEKERMDDVCQSIAPCELLSHPRRHTSELVLTSTFNVLHAVASPILGIMTQYSRLLVCEAI
ncbi:hypothetical protein PENSPDRAFT_646286 [Peniophora sp. CONT]|nr:hypothetical protein PENSPDRAFT_646286 [Peniophora sp. CONT]